jgi:hypothetical protein
MTHTAVTYWRYSAVGLPVVDVRIKETRDEKVRGDAGSATTRLHASLSLGAGRDELRGLRARGDAPVRVARSPNG